MTNESSKATGMVISTMPIGEYDKRIVLLTKEYGKITVFARGAKRPRSSYGAACEPFCMGEFYIYEGRSAYTLSKVVVKDYFEELKSDLSAIWMGSYFLEVAQYYTHENGDGTQQLNLLYISLKALTDDRFDNRLVKAVYELKTLCINGEQPDLTGCRECGKTEPLTRFVVGRNGCMCDDCNTQMEGVPISAGCLHAMRYVEGSPLASLFAFSVKESVIDEFAVCMESYYERWVEKDFRSLKTMDQALAGM